MNAFLPSPAVHPRRRLARAFLLALACLALSACSVLGGNTRERATIYDLDPRVAALEAAGNAQRARTLEDSGRIQSVARQGSGVSAEYRLLLELRRFESAYTAAGLPPTVQIELNAKLLHTPSQRVAASRTFLQQTPTASVAIEDVVAAFDKGLHALTGDIVGWVLTSGNQDAKRRTD